MNETERRKIADEALQESFNLDKSAGCQPTVHLETIVQLRRIALLLETIVQLLGR